MASSIGDRWVRLNVTFYHDPKLRRGRCAAIWPYVLALLGEKAGFIPDDYLDPTLIAADLSLQPSVVKSQLESCKEAGLLVWGSGEAEIGGRGGPHFKQREGWTTPNWSQYQADPRRNSKRRSEEQPQAPERERVSITDETGSLGIGAESFAGLESTAIACIPATGRRGRPLSLDPMSRKVLKGLADKHGLETVFAALEKCGGAERPISMARSILDGKGAAKGGPPTAAAFQEG